MPPHLCLVYDVFMPTFIPPTEDAVVYGDPLRRGPEYRLWSFYARTLRGKNVYRLTNGTFVEVEPRNLSTVSRVFFGSHNNYVTDAEADALVAAGLLCCLVCLRLVRLIQVPSGLMLFWECNARV